MSPDQKTVFISYRRDASEAHARLIYDRLKAHGYDVFFDYESLPSGKYQETILSQIGSRAHYVIMLAPGTLKRCESTSDLLRREIEHALALKRDIVPVFQKDFDFKFQRYKKQLVGELARLLDFQGVPLTSLSDAFLRATVDTLVGYFEKAPQVDLVVATPEAQAQAEKAAEVIAGTPEPTPARLTAEEYFNRAYDEVEQGDLDGAIVDLSEAIRLDPQYAWAYHNRGAAWIDKGDRGRAIADFSEAIRLDPQNARTYYNRGLAWHHGGDLDKAIADYDEAIRLNPQDAVLHSNRGAAWADKGDFVQAVADYSTAINHDPRLAMAYNNRGEVQFALGDYAAACDDYQAALELDPALKYSLAGLPIALHALGQVDEALTHWRALLDNDARYADADWVGKEFNWPPSLVEEARKLIAKL